MNVKKPTINEGLEAPYQVCTKHTKEAWEQYIADHPWLDDSTDEPELPEDPENPLDPSLPTDPDDNLNTEEWAMIWMSDQWKEYGKKVKSYLKYADFTRIVFVFSSFGISCYE